MANNINILKQLNEQSNQDNFEVVTNLGDYIAAIASFVLTVGGAATFVYLVWGGVKWLTAGSDTNKVDEARKHLTNAIVGLAIIALSWAIFIILDRFFGLGIAAPFDPKDTKK